MIESQPVPKLTRIQDLTPAEWNPRTIDKPRFDNLRKAIRDDPRFLWNRPICASNHPEVLALAKLPPGSAVIYAGNYRYRAVVAEGMHEVPAIVESLGLEEIKRRAIRDNSNWGEWQDQELAEMLATMHGDTTTLGFDEGELQRLLAIVGLAEDRTDADFDPSPPEIPDTAPGDKFKLGDHILICGDARDPDVWSRLMLGETADAMWTDPPYGVGLGLDAGPSGDFRERLQKRRKGPKAFEGDPFAELEPLLFATFPLADRHLRPGGAFYIAAPHSPPQFVAFIHAAMATGWHLSQTLVWVKNSIVPAMQDYHYQHEAIIYGWKTGHAHHWNMHGDESTTIDDEPDVARLDRPGLLELIRNLRNQRGADILRADKPRLNDVHPTMKPTKLIRVMLGNSTVRGSIVLEPFAGSGSTMVACEQMGRRAYQLELEPRFCDVIRRRYHELTGLEAQKITG